MAISSQTNLPVSKRNVCSLRDTASAATSAATAADQGLIFAPVGVFTRLSKSEQRTVTGKAKTHHMLDAKKVWLFGRLKHSLRLLASQAEIQFRELPTFCNKSDELFISYNNWRMALMGNFQSEITAQQLSCLEAIQQQFGRMGRESWTDGAVNNSAEWEQIRRLSSAALEAFRWSY